LLILLTVLKIKILKFLLMGVALLLATARANAQSQAPPAGTTGTTPPPAVPQKPGKPFGEVMLKLGKGLLREVSRRLNLEEAEIITVKKEATPDGGVKYHVDTGKFQFDVKKKPKPPKQR
jgi:hypothetical protein